MARARPTPGSIPSGSSPACTPSKELYTPTTGAPTSFGLSKATLPLAVMEYGTVERIRVLLGGVDIATLASQIHTEEEDLAPSVVKAIGTSLGGKRMRALYFTRATAPTGDGPRYHHIGLYAYRRAALERYVSLPPSPLELQEKLEQLRALEAGMRIDFTIVDTVPRGVDTPADLETARGILSKS